MPEPLPVKELLDDGADPNYRDEDGITALMTPRGFSESDINIVKLLLKLGARPNDVDDNGNTAYITLNITYCKLIILFV